MEPEYHYSIAGQENALSKEFLVQNARELGVQAAWKANGAAAHHFRIGDNWQPYVNVDWGVGVTASLITGNEKVFFEESTSYSSGPVIKTWDDLDKLHLDIDNIWVQCVRQFWKGVESVDLMEGICVMPNMYRSPLDFANDLRGNDIFVDMYDNPKEVEALVEYCAKAIMQLDCHLREECSLLRIRPGGIWGVGLKKEGIFLNGDPVDLISEEMGRRFNNPFVEMLTSSDKAVYIHHHSIGHSRANMVNEIKGLAVQEILQDPNGPKLVDVINDDLISASLKVPIHLDVDMSHSENYESILEQLCSGQFIVSLGSATPERLNSDREFSRRLKLAQEYQLMRKESTIKKNYG